MKRKLHPNLKWPQKMNEIFGDFILLNLALVQTLKLKKKFLPDLSIAETFTKKEQAQYDDMRKTYFCD